MAKVCKECKIPMIVTRDQIWQKNGRITATRTPDFRLVMLERDHFVDLYSTLEALYGKVIPNCFTQGTRKNARIYINGLLKGPLGFFARSRFGSRKVYDALVETCLGLGYGTPTVTEYNRKSRLVVEILNNIYPPHFLGDLRGAFEATDRIATSGHIVRIGKNKHRFIVEATTADDPLEDRFGYYDNEKRDIGEELERCGTCGLPIEMRRFDWDIERSMIHDPVNDERVFIIGFNDILAIMHELEKLSGELIRDHVKDITMPHGYLIGERHGEDSFDLIAKDFRIKGIGYTEIDRKGEIVTVKVHNPFYTPIIEGKLAGIYQAVIGRKPKVNRIKDDGLLKIVMG